MRNLAWALASLSLFACGGGGPYCDRAGAEAALMGASPGDTVELGACEIEGPLRVPPGVTLAGTDGTVVVAPIESGAIVALGGSDAAPTVVRDLRVRVEGRIGILLRGGGTAEVQRVAVEARRGIALGASELASLELTDVSLEGPVTADDADDPRWLRVLPAPVEPAECPGCECAPGTYDAAEDRVCDAAGRFATWTATHGLVLTRIVTAALSNVDVHGFAEWGALFTESAVDWRGGAVEDTIGVGIRQVGGTLGFADLTVAHTHAGLRGDRPYGVIVSDGGGLYGDRMRVHDNDRYGILVAGARGRITDLVATDNGDAALWIAESTSFGLDGVATRVADNDFAGVVVLASSDVVLAEGAIDRTRTVERPVGAIGLVRVGDGVQIADTRGNVELRDLVLEDNERAGLVLDLGASGVGDAAFARVTVNGTGAQLGAIAGRPSAAGQLTVELPAGWDTGIVREGATGANDAAFAGTIQIVPEPLPGALPDPGEVLGVVAPMF